MEGGPKSLKAGLKLDDEGRDGEGTEEPGQKRRTDITHYSWNLTNLKTMTRNLLPETFYLNSGRLTYYHGKVS